MRMEPVCKPYLFFIYFLFNTYLLVEDAVASSKPSEPDRYGREREREMIKSKATAVRVAYTIIFRILAMIAAISVQDKYGWRRL